MNIFRKLKKAICLLLIISIVFMQITVKVNASELPSSPESPQAPETPQTTQVAETPQSPETPQSSETTQTTESTQQAEVPSEDDSLTQSTDPQSDTDSSDENQDEVIQNSSQEGEQAIASTQDALGDTTDSTGAQKEDGYVGDPLIETGDANISGSIINTGNLNATASDDYLRGVGGASIIIEGNGASSDNSGSIIDDSTSTTTQTNGANIDNNLNLLSTSGDNSTSANVGNSTIDTGDADVSGTIVNAVNTNVEGLAVAEFNIIDNYTGDYILDFSKGCVIGCVQGGSLSSIENTGNGTESANTGDITTNLDSTTFQNNDANVVNDMVLVADSGGNVANDNTGGDSTITTGDANASGNVLNFLNNNLAGNVLYTTVNIFGDLTGDIIAPESYLSSLLNNSSITNSGNGSGSTNTGTINQTDTTDVYQFNNAEIINNIDLFATTGGNNTSQNTGGDNNITTGEANVDAQVVNIANNNIVGGDWWIVLVNEAGNWVGKILGLSSDSSFGNLAASSGTDFSIDPNGTINIANTSNGTDSNNSGVVNQTTSDSITQQNTASITNNIYLSANTGNNSVSRNTGGDNNITTGDANVMLNLVNFVNNNFTNGRVVLTVVNVFGNWIGDFLTPGATKENKENSTEDVISPLAQNQESQGVGPSQGGRNNSTSNNGNSSSGTNSTEVSSEDNLTTFVSNTGAGNITSGGNDDSQPEVAGVSNVREEKLSAPKKTKTKINLAWAITLIPFAGMILGIRSLARHVSFRRKILQGIVTRLL